MICTPDHWHVPMSVLAVKAGKDVCCEKPLTRSIAEGRLLSDLVTQHKRVFRTDSEFRSLPQFHRAVELVRNGRIGKLHTIRTGVPFGVRPLSRRRRTWTCRCRRNWTTICGRVRPR